MRGLGKAEPTGESAVPPSEAGSRRRVRQPAEAGRPLRDCTEPRCASATEDPVGRAVADPKPTARWRGDDRAGPALRSTPQRVRGDRGARRDGGRDRFRGARNGDGALGGAGRGRVGPWCRTSRDGGARARRRRAGERPRTPAARRRPAGTRRSRPRRSVAAPGADASAGWVSAGQTTRRFARTVTGGFQRSEGRR